MAPPITSFVDVQVSLSAAASDKFSFGTLLGAFAHTHTTNRTDGPFATVAELNDAGFTAATTPEVNAWATAALSQDNGVDKVLVGRKDAGDVDWTATLDAIETAAGDESWYLTNIESRVKADILLAAAWIEARQKVGIWQSSDAGVLASTAGNVALSLQTAGYKRSAYIWHAIDDADDGNAPPDAYLDGAWTGRCGGFNLDGPGGVGGWSFKKLNGIPFDKFTSAQATAAWAANANLFGKTKGLSFTSKGTMASGRFIDITTSLDWIKTRLEENILSMFVGATERIPYTREGINIVRAAAQEVFDKGVSYGHLSKDSPAILSLPNISEVSDSDKAARELNGKASGVLAGGVQKFILKFNVKP